MVDYTAAFRCEVVCLSMWLQCNMAPTTIVIFVRLVTSKLVVIPVSNNFEDRVDNFFIDFAKNGRVLQSSFEDGSDLTISLRQ